MQSIRCDRKKKHNRFKKQITITKSITTKIDYTKEILTMHYVEYINTFEVFVNKYIVPSINIRLITSLENEL